MTSPAPPSPPSLATWWFYASPLPLDDPLSPLPMTTSSTLAQKHPPRPFSHLDTGALERAYQDLLISQAPPTEYAAPPLPPPQYSRTLPSLGKNGLPPYSAGKKRSLTGIATSLARDKLSSEPQTPTHLRHYSRATEQREYAEEGRGNETLNAPFIGEGSPTIPKEPVNNSFWSPSPTGLILRGRTLGRAGMKLETDEEALARVLRQDEQSPARIAIDNRTRRRSISPEVNPWTGNPISPTRDSSASPSGSASSSINPPPVITTNPFIRSLSYSRRKPSRSPSPSATVKRQKSSSVSSTLSTASLPDSPTTPDAPKVKQKEVPVGVQRLYKVLLPSLTMTPIYWSPVHDISGVSRATWFYKDTMLPVETDLANRLERGYCEVRAWTEEWEAELASAVEVGREGEEKIRWKLWEYPPITSAPSTRPGTSHAKTEPMEILGGGRGRFQDGSGIGSLPGSKSTTPSNRRNMFASYSGNQTPARTGTSPPYQFSMQQPLPPSPRSTTTSNLPPDEPGMPSVPATTSPPASSAAFPNPNDWVIFANAREAYICRDSLLGFGNKRPLASIRKGVTTGVGARVIRGFDIAEWNRLHPKHKISGSERLKNGIGTAVAPGIKDDVSKVEELKNEKNLASGVDAKEAQEDFDNRQEVSDLFLVIHGIGQKLSERVESFHFTHSINSFRRLLNTELCDPAVIPHLRDKSKGMMVLPVNWRSNLSFEDGIPPPVNSSSKSSHKNNYSLGDITLQTIPAVRNLIGDVMLDIPYYLSHHKKKMIKAVVDEANRVYGLWREYNPDWEERGGRVHLIAHSLGSAIALDVLSRQPTRIAEWRASKEQMEKERAVAEAGAAQASTGTCFGCSGRGKLEREQREREGKEKDKEAKCADDGLIFDFDTSNLFCAGSPAGFFLLLNRSMLVPRRNRRKPGATAGDYLDAEITAEAGTYGCLAVDNIYNIMHPSDPIAYRLNPTVDTAYAESVKLNCIPSTTSTLFENISSTLRSVLPIGSGSSASSGGASSSASAIAAVEGGSGLISSSTATTTRKGLSTMKFARLPSTIEMETHDFSREEIAERRMYLLNENGTTDWLMGSLGALLENQYINMLGAHSSYWESKDLAAFLVLECGRRMGREFTLANVRAVKREKI